MSCRTTSTPPLEGDPRQAPQAIGRQGGSRLRVEGVPQCPRAADETLEAPCPAHFEGVGEVKLEGITNGPSGSASNAIRGVNGPLTDLPRPPRLALVGPS